MIEKDRLKALSHCKIRLCNDKKEKVLCYGKMFHKALGFEKYFGAMSSVGVVKKRFSTKCMGGEINLVHYGVETENRLYDKCSG